MIGVGGLVAESTQGTVVLATYSRPDLLKKCLESIYTAYSSSSIRKVIVVQGSDPKVKELVESFADQNTIILRSEATGTPLQCINSNYWRGFDFAFMELQSEWVLCLEEDSVISSDAYSFIEQMHFLHRENFFYRGLNLGSLEIGPGLHGTYSCLRMGFNGNAGVVTRKMWNRILKLNIRTQLNNYPFDGATRFLWRTGYVLVPNMSLYMNYGWVDGTHVTPDVDMKFFSKLENSWKANRSVDEFFKLNIKHTWAQDVKKFSYREQPRAILFYLMFRWIGHDFMDKFLSRRHSRKVS